MFVYKSTVAQCQKDLRNSKAICMNLELQMQNNVLKSGQQSQFLKEKGNEAKVKHDIDVIETINIELEHRVATLLKENETLKRHYKEMFDSIKTTRAKNIEHTTSLIATNDKFKAQIQEKGFGISLKQCESKTSFISVAGTLLSTGTSFQSLEDGSSLVAKKKRYRRKQRLQDQPRFLIQRRVNNAVSKPRSSSMTSVHKNRQNSEFKTTAMKVKFNAGVEELNKNVWITGLKKEALHTNLRQKQGHTYAVRIQVGLLTLKMTSWTVMNAQPSQLFGFLSLQKLVSFVTAVHKLSIDISFPRLLILNRWQTIQPLSYKPKTALLRSEPRDQSKSCFRDNCIFNTLVEHLRPELVQETTDKVVMIRDRVKAARDLRFGKKGKLAPRFVGPFEILERIGPVAYRLRLPEELSSVHDTFHVSNLKKCLADANLHVPLDEIKLSKIPIVKVRWNFEHGPKFTWEREDHMKAKYPQLFGNAILENNG
ncbi:hypothetical protein Tco_1524131 [Tanacetum coccineum]